MKLHTCGTRLLFVSGVDPRLVQSNTDKIKAGDSRISFNGHIFQPLKFNADGSVQDLNCEPDARFEVPFLLGDGAPATGRATAATDGSPRLANVCYLATKIKLVADFLSMNQCATRTYGDYIKLGRTAKLGY